MNRRYRTKLLSISLSMALLLPGAVPAVYAEETPAVQEAAVSLTASAPAENTPAPAEPSASTPAESAPAPAEQSASKPAESTPAPAEPSASTPAESTPAPAEQSASTPAENTPAPAEQSASAPAENTPAPAEQSASAPAENTPAPTEQGTGASAENMSAENTPEEPTSAPEKNTAAENTTEEPASAPEESTPAENTTEEPASTPEENAPASEEAPADTMGESTPSEEDEVFQIASANAGVYYYGSKLDGTDITDIYIYDDDFLKGNSMAYSSALATMSLCLVNASISSKRTEDYVLKSQNLQAYLEDNGFSGFKANSYYASEPTLESMGVACAFKTITDGGKTYTLLVIAPRSAGYKTEWGGNFKIGTEGDHEGFQRACDIVLNFAKEYVREKGITGDIKVWTAGGSRGAGVTNLVGKALLESPHVLGNNVNLSPENLYCYTFGTPKTADTSNPSEDVHQARYQYIHNHSEENDVVGIFAPSGLGFDRYGEVTHYADPELKDVMEQYLRALSENVFNTYEKGDPDNFVPKTIDLTALFAGRPFDMDLLFSDKTDSYLEPMNQADYMGLLEDTLSKVFGSRENYVNTYEEPMQRFFGYVYGGSGELGTLFSGVKNSGYLVPTVLSMYVSIVLEKYETNKKEEIKTDLKNAVKELKEALDALDLSEVLTEDERALIETQYDKLVTDLDTAVDSALQQDSPLLKKSWELAANLYGRAMRKGLENINTITPEIKDKLCSEEDSKAMTKLLSHLLLTDTKQNQAFNLDSLGQQFVHLATTLGNAKSFMTPHYNEVILSWLRANDANYQDYASADSAQKAGYRRVYVEKIPGVDVTGTVRDSKGNVVAVFKNGELLSTTSKWIGMTTSDSGNWLRLPVNDTYRIDFEVSKDTVLNVKVSEYSVENGHEVRTETSDAKYDWKNFALRTVDSASLVISAVAQQAGEYTLNSGAAYYFDLLKRSFITYMLDGGTLDNTSGTISRLYDNGTGITLPTPYREGYRFAYWEGSRYYAGDLFTVLGDHIFRAIWEKIGDPIPAEEQSGPAEPQALMKAVEYENKKSSQRQYEQAPDSANADARLLSAQQAAAVNTADTTPVELWMMIMAAALCAAVCMTYWRRKRSAGTT